MRSLTVFAVLSVFSALLFAERTKIEETSKLGIVLLNPYGEPIIEYPLPTSKNEDIDIVFKPMVDPGLIGYKSWLVEVQDPKQQVTHELGADGKVPDVIHWDGFFAENPKLRPNSKILFRILLFPKAGGTPLASPWSFFQTRMRAESDVPKFQKSALKLHFSPKGGFFYSLLKTKGSSSYHFPTLSAEIKAHYGESHSLGLALEASSNVIFNYREEPNAFFYSDIGIYYLYRIVGNVTHKPEVSFVPGYMPKDFKLGKPASAAFGSKSNFELGVKYFSTHLRGFGSEVIDAELGRAMKGFAGIVNWNYGLGPVRAYWDLEGGYTLLQGKILMLKTQLTFSYDHWVDCSPGIFIRGQMMTGDAQDDDFDGVTGGAATGIQNQLISAGITLLLKI